MSELENALQEISLLKKKIYVLNIVKDKKVDEMYYRARRAEKQNELLQKQIELLQKPKPSTRKRNFK